MSAKQAEQIRQLQRRVDALEQIAERQGHALAALSARKRGRPSEQDRQAIRAVTDASH